ncbi:hypothetical protein HMPREF0063_10382 [Aeromicrobium marinum DSM 15272]|uniref:Maltokinase N-terminal cap domain-containing protein n=1 Tax=Aeromicrobium marinum DSM 15272 TaxID=585531 RepID=E2S8M5_9ACTN|nr:hypothetical protein [Aeromicrobium marinum]EFQ84530.1 hypothetical protein HMPREF0063_10382 [Aeromicrobium marinum DSM 15272]
MAHVHGGADARPTKLELIAAWREDPDLVAIGSYRFDDPDGEVGIETHLLNDAAGRVLQVPLTYRGAPLAGADEWLVGTMEHTALGRRWVYDACADPVYVQTITVAMLTGGTHAEVHREFPTGAPRSSRRRCGSRAAAGSRTRAAWVWSTCATRPARPWS